MSDPTLLIRMWMIRERDELQISCRSLFDAIAAFKENVRALFYLAVLLDHVCPACGGNVRMTREGRCGCERCRRTLDPTVIFQRCPRCDGTLRLNIRRYECRQCGFDVVSRYLFDGLVFDAEYFRRKMAEHREREARRYDELRELPLMNRSGAIDLGGYDLNEMPGLVDALDALVNAHIDHPSPEMRPHFDLRKYQAHLLSCLDENQTSFDDVPVLTENRRQDRIGLFIAMIFLLQTGRVFAFQEKDNILLTLHDPHRKG